MDPRIPVSCSMPSLQQQQMQMQYMNPYSVALPVVTQHQPMPAYLTDPTSIHRLNPALYGNSTAQYQLPPLSHLPPNSCEYSMSGQMITPPMSYSVATVISGTNTVTPTTDCLQTVQASQITVNQALQPNQLQSTTENLQTSNQVLVQATPVNTNTGSIEGNSMQMSTVNTSDIQTESLTNNGVCQNQQQAVGTLDKVTEPSSIKEELDNVAKDNSADYDADTDIEDHATEEKELETNVEDTNGSWPYMCILCNETFTLKKQLQKHKMMPCKKMLYIKNRCDFCRRNFTRSDHVSRHIKTVHAHKFKMWQSLQMKRREMRARQTKKGRMREEMKTRTCQYCLKVFRSIEEKDIHVRHHIGEEMPYLCTVCQCKFTEESQLKLHRRTRCGKNAFKCTMCDFAAISPRVIQRHEMCHTGEKPYKCEICNKGFMSKAALKVHRYAHTGEKPFACTECNKAFTTQEHLKRHRMIHTGERPFKCSHCDATFNQKNTLRAHEICHETSKPYICQDCGLTFATLSNLRTHLRTHGGEKSYTCKYCNRQFGRTDTLAKHERTHTGEKPFVCRYCGQAYSRADKLHKHEKSHEGPTTSTPIKKGKEGEAEMTIPADEQAEFTSPNDIMAYAYHLACDYPNQEQTPDATIAPLSADMPPVYQENQSQVKEKSDQFVKECCKAMDETFRTVQDGNIPNVNGNENETVKEPSMALPDPIASISIKKEIPEETGEGDTRRPIPTSITQTQQPTVMDHSGASDTSVVSINSSMNTSMNMSANTSMNNSIKEEVAAYDESTDEGEGPTNADNPELQKPKKYKVAHICEICNKRYSSKHAVQRHKKALHKIGDKPYRCCDCNEDFETQVLFEEHHKLHTFLCLLCPRTFITEASLKKHQERHKNQKVHVCATCNKAFVRKDHLQIHEKRHLSGKTTMRHVECQYCCMAFLNKEDAVEHERTSHDPNEDKPYLCLICREQFTTMALLITHKYLHKGQKPFNCNHCSRSFRFHSALLAHSKTHTGEKPFKCDLCDDRFTTLAHTKRHMQTHLGEKPYSCDVCKTQFSQLSSLKAHHQRAHADAEDQEALLQSFACETCGAAFKSLANLQTHQRKHLGIKSHECTYCQKKFARSDTLKNHERIHRGEKPFVCSVCSVAFTRKDKMKAHEKRHEANPNGVLPVARKSKVADTNVAHAVQVSIDPTSTVSSLPAQIIAAAATPASISTPAPLVTATLLPTVSTAAVSQQLAAVVTATPIVATSTSAYATMPPPSSPAPQISSAYQHLAAPTNALPQAHHLTHTPHHLYATSAASVSGSAVAASTSKVTSMPPPGPLQHSTTAPNYSHHHPSAVYSHTPSPHHIYHPSPAPSPHYSPAPSPSPYAPGQVSATIPAAAAAMTGYFTEHANQAAAMSYHATPLFTTNPAPPQAYQITHSSVMHL